MLLRALVISAVALVAAAPPAGASHRDRVDPPGAREFPERTPRVPRIPNVESDPNPPLPTVAPRARRQLTEERPAPRSARGESSARSLVVSEGNDLGRRMIALTLDDGFKADPRILDLVESWQIRGTAFLVGAVVEDNPGLVRRLVRAGWEVCSHTYSHKLLTGMSDGAIEREIVRGADAIQRAARGLRMSRCRYFRPPAGAVNGRVVAVARRLGYTVVNWNASISDSTSLSTPTALQVDIALRTIRPGSILLGHFGGAHSYAVLKEVLQTVFERGYRVGTVTDLLQGRDIAAPGAEKEPSSIEPVYPDPFAETPIRWEEAAKRVHPGGWAGAGFLIVGGALLGTSSALARRRRAAADPRPQGVAELEPALSGVV